MKERVDEKTGTFFSKNFNILNFLIQGGILITILSFVFESGVYYEQVNKIINNIDVIKKDMETTKEKIINLDKRTDIIEQLKLDIKKNEEQLEALQKCQRNKKFC